MAIKQIKIYGERNSGTNYLTRVLAKNYKLINNDKSGLDIIDGATLDGTGWKHGKPLPSILNKNTTLYIIIIRDLEDWLLSMYHNSYHIRPIKQYGTGDFNTFITKPGFSLQYNMMEYFPIKYQFHGIYLDAIRFELNKNLFDLRYTKFNEYMKLTKNNNVAILNLKYFQNNPEATLDILDDKYKLKELRNDKFSNFEKHCKTRKNEKNRKYDTSIIDKNVIRDYKNTEIEEMITNLTVNCYSINTTN